MREILCVEAVRGIDAVRTDASSTALAIHHRTRPLVAAEVCSAQRTGQPEEAARLGDVGLPPARLCSEISAREGSPHLGTRGNEAQPTGLIPLEERHLLTDVVDHAATVLVGSTFSGTPCARFAWIHSNVCLMQ